MNSTKILVACVLIIQLSQVCFSQSKSVSRCIRFIENGDVLVLFGEKESELSDREIVTMMCPARKKIVWQRIVKYDQLSGYTIDQKGEQVAFLHSEVSQDEDEYVEISDARTGKSIKTLDRMKYSLVGNISFVPNRSSFLATRDNFALLFDKEGKSFQINPILYSSEKCGFTDDGELLYTLGMLGVNAFWDTTNGKKAFEWKSNSYIVCLSKHPTEDRIVTINRIQGLELRDLKSGKVLHSFANGRKVGCFDALFDPSGKTFVTFGGSSQATVWDYESKKELHDLSHGSKTAITRCYFLKGGKEMISLARDNSVIVWDLRNGKAKFRIESKVKIIDFAGRPNGRQIVTLNEKGVAKLWNDEGKLLGQIKAQIK